MASTASRWPPLSTGDEEGGSDEAVRLFRERCAPDAPDVPLDSPETISRICRRLEGIPLAVELACARLRENSPDEIAERLTSRLDTLVDDTVWPERHRALTDDAEHGLAHALQGHAGP